MNKEVGFCVTSCVVPISLIKLGEAAYFVSLLLKPPEIHGFSDCVAIFKILYKLISEYFPHNFSLI